MGAEKSSSKPVEVDEAGRVVINFQDLAARAARAGSQEGETQRAVNYGCQINNVPGCAIIDGGGPEM